MRLPNLLLLAFAASLVAACGEAAPDGVDGTDESVGSQLSCDARAYGAKGDGKTDDTAAIQRAIDACAGKGGEVHLQQGTFVSGMLTLKSHLTFHVHGGATLKGTLDMAKYPDTAPPTNNSQLSNCKKALLYAESVTDLHLTGTGVIDGSGDAAQWVGSSKAIPEATRPMAIFFVASNDVSIENLTVQNSAMWSVVNMETDNLQIRAITVNSTHGSTRDGIDVVDCHHVLIDGVTVSSEDDSICLKSGVARGVDDVQVRNSHVLGSGVANALKLGTASYGPFTNITFDTIDVAHADKAAMAVEAVDGSLVQNVTFRNITFHDVGTPFFMIVGDRGVRPAYTPRKIGSIDGVTFDHVTGDGVRHDWGAIATGYDANGTSHRITNVKFSDVDVTMQGGFASVPADPPEYAGQYPDPNLWNEVPASGLYLRHADGIRFENSVFRNATTDARPLLDAVDVTSLAGPSADVTFTLTVAPGAPTYSASDSFRILGKTTVPAGIGALASDPLGAWSKTAGVALVPTTPDAQGHARFVGHASLPQGAAFEYKAVVGTGTTLRYERSAAGNREDAVPLATSAAIDLDWQN